MHENRKNSYFTSAIMNVAGGILIEHSVFTLRSLCNPVFRGNCWRRNKRNERF